MGVAATALQSTTFAVVGVVASYCAFLVLLTVPFFQNHDYDIPWSHSEQLFWHAVDATEPAGISFEELGKQKSETRVDMGAGGWGVERRTGWGLIREQILKNGLHDRIMGFPAVGLAVHGAFRHGGTG
ncbi:hypothetical protein ACO1O0_001280 [Amphichorda felina]